MNKSKTIGFTLIELLVVIVLIGTLAGLVLFAINPLEQIARSHDASRKTSISQVGRAIQNYMVFNSTYPSPPNLQTSLTNTSDLNPFPSNPPGIVNSCSSTSGQGARNINGYCYNVSAEGSYPYAAIIYSQLESAIESKNCPNKIAWYVWSSEVGGAGIVCTDSVVQEPSETISGFN